jgi:hypothetical protein
MWPISLRKLIQVIQRKSLMKQEIVRKSKWFWPWQDDKEEAWLEEMSHQGLHLKQAQIMAQYDFVPGQPTDYTYRLDFQSSFQKQKKDEYLRLFSDTGWEHLGEMNGWQYFRKISQSGEASEIFTDPETKIQKYKRFLTWFLVTFPSSWFIIFVLFSDESGWVMWISLIVFLCMSALWVMVVLKIQQRIRQLKTI